MHEEINGVAAGFKPFTKKHFSLNFQVVNLNSIFLGDLLAKS